MRLAVLRSHAQRPQYPTRRVEAQLPPLPARLPASHAIFIYGLPPTSDLGLLFTMLSVRAEKWTKVFARRDDVVGFTRGRSGALLGKLISHDPSFRVPPLFVRSKSQSRRIAPFFWLSAILQDTHIMRADNFTQLV